MGISDGSRHHCSVSTIDAVRNLTKNLPKDVQEKLALEILKQRQTEATTREGSHTIFLPPVQGGLAIPVLVGQKAPATTTLPKFTHQKLMTMTSSAHMSGNQMRTLAADLRVKLGRNVVEAGFDTAMVEHNSMYKVYFSAEKKIFWDSDGNMVEKAFFWCNNVKEFLEVVARKRGKVLDECSVKIGGDTGKGFLKITASIYNPGTSSQEKSERRK